MRLKRHPLRRASRARCGRIPGSEQQPQSPPLCHPVAALHRRAGSVDRLADRGASEEAQHRRLRSCGRSVGHPRRRGMRLSGRDLSERPPVGHHEPPGSASRVTRGLARACKDTTRLARAPRRVRIVSPVPAVLCPVMWFVSPDSLVALHDPQERAHLCRRRRLAFGSPTLHAAPPASPRSPRG